MKHIKLICIGFLLSMVSVQLVAQSSLRLPQKLTLILPDGRVLQPDKLDSLEKAWGKGKVSLLHTEEDDAKGVMHLVQVTDEIMKDSEARAAQAKQSLMAMLNQPAPSFELKDMQGQTWHLDSLRGKIVVLNFWFTSCMPCIQEMPALNKLAGGYAKENVVFLALTFNDEDMVRNFLKKRKFEYTVLANSQQVDEKYKVVSWPTSIVIDKEGYVRMITGSGENTGIELEEAIERLRK